MWALIPLIVLLVVVGHVVMDMINARRDQQFYEELLKVHVQVRDER